MTQNEALAMASSVRAHALPEALLIRFLSELEGRVKREIRGETGQEKPSPVAYKNPLLSAPAPYDRLYWSYLVAMIDLTVGDMEAYTTSFAIFHEAWAAYARAFQRTGGRCG